MGRWSRHAVPVSSTCWPQLGSAHTSTAEPPSDSAIVRSCESSTVTYRYVTQAGIERTLRFAVDGSDDIAGALPSSPSGPLKEYEDKLKAIDLCAAGLERCEIARRLGRSENWVKRWWRQNPHQIAKPEVAHGVLVKNAPLMSFRDLELRRGFLDRVREDTGCKAECAADFARCLFDDLLMELHWEPARRATRDAITGDLKVRFDPQGRSMVQPKRFVAEYRGGLSRLDVVLQHAAAVANIRDPNARVFLNRYEDGGATCPSHRHDFWTCMLSLGCERVAIIENRPLLLRPGDLLVFGTQAHGLPQMPDVEGRRISVVVFYMPEADGLERQWCTVGLGSEGTGQKDNDDDGCDDRCSKQDTSLAIAKAVASATSRLVDAEFLGCPGISLGLVARRTQQVTAPVDVFTVGCGILSEADFFGVLEWNRVAVIWDLRRRAARCARHWAPGDSLRRVCAIRMLQYFYVPLGRQDAGGICKHLGSEEGRDVLVRIAAAAEEHRSNQRHAVILGEAECWRDCERQAVAAELVSGRFGSISVIHISAKGAEQHPKDAVLPAWLGPAPTRDSRRPVVACTTIVQHADDADVCAPMPSSGYGDSAPLAPSPSAADKQQNRVARRRWESSKQTGCVT